jgi:hypothetical protein
MSRVIPFIRRSVASGTPADGETHCAHRNIRLVERGEIVSCSDCLAVLSPFWALTMLSQQYSLAMSQIERLTTRTKLADARILELSQELDANSREERRQNPPSTDT